MKRLFPLLVALLCSCNLDVTSSTRENKCEQPSWSVHFSPKGGITENIVHAINGANKSVYVQAYSFTSSKIAEALIAKKGQNKTVVVLLDKSDLTGKGSVVQLLLDAKIPVFIDSRHAIAHNKVIVIDEITVFTGSFNFTNAAENSNAENSLEIHDVALSKEYLSNWKSHREHSLLQ